MQSIFRLPWCSDAPGIDTKPDMMALQQKQQRQTPVVDLSLLNKLKRKRSDSVGIDLTLDHDAKRKRPLETEIHLSGSYEYWQSQPDSAASSRRDSHDASADLKSAPVAWMTPDSLPQDGTAASRMDDGAPLASAHIVESELSPIQQAIEHQFNLEIMIKHRELRLIEQELAKCQTALEQLRRCEIIPYPGYDGLSADLSAGTGPAVRAPPGTSQPSAPAPWGVTDGPYSRHYSQWLMPDPTFDSLAPAQTQEAVRGDGRPVRNSFGGWAKPLKSRSQRESISLSASEALHAAAPAPAAPPRAKGGPLVLKRMSDNQYVKLVCTKCHRSDFSSVQGFLNHCRIAHKIDYKSHEAAAQDCGHPLEDHEAELAATAPPPVGSTVRAAAPKVAPPPPAVSKVHHLNHAIIPRPTWKRQRQEYIDALNKQQTAPVATMSLTQPTQTKGSLVPATEQPFLSARLAQHGMGVDLAAIVAKLGEKIDLGPEPEDIDETVSAADTPAGRKGFSQAGNRPRPAPLNATPSIGSPEPGDSFNEHDLSPRTADSNPGLVSDHDDDMNSDPEDEASVIVPRDALRISQGCGDAMDVDMVGDDDHAILIRSRDSMQSDGELSVASPSRVRTKYRRE